MAGRYISSLSVYLLAFKSVRVLHKCAVLVLENYMDIHQESNEISSLSEGTANSQKR